LFFLLSRYEHGIGGVIADIETAAQYSLLPADSASHLFHTIGGQPVIEADRIDDNTEPDIGKGNQGNDDELIQYQKIRAQEVKTILSHFFYMQFTNGFFS
jgi:hypothetical protein